MRRAYWPTQEWRTVDQISVGIKPQMSADLERMIASSYGNLNGIIVARRGYIVFEKYYNGFDPDTTHNVASVTKSFISALIGIAIDSGYIKNVNQKVLEFFPEYVSEDGDIQKRTITIKHLLSMTAPFQFAWKSGDRRGHEPLDRLRRQKDWVTYILDLMGRNGQPGQFQYSTAGAHLLSAIITRATGMCAREFANQHLFRPIGIKEIPHHNMKSFQLEEVFGKNVTGWISDPGGNTIGGWGLTITIRDMARLGFLYLNRGVWEDRQIISGEWIDESINFNSRTQIDQSGDFSYNGYGFLWWLRGGKGVFAYSALGDGGNLICCVPEKDLVVAIASKIGSQARDRWPILEECILPAVTD